MRTELERAFARLRVALNGHEVSAMRAFDLVHDELVTAYAALPAPVGSAAPLGETTLGERIAFLDAALTQHRIALGAREAQLASATAGGVPTVVTDAIDAAFWEPFEEQGLAVRWEMDPDVVRDGLRRAFRVAAAGQADLDDCPVGYTPHRRGSDPDGCVECAAHKVRTGDFPPPIQPRGTVKIPDQGPRHAAPEPAEQPRRDGHTPIVHGPGYHSGEDAGQACQFCDGGLFGCSVCGSFEGATTDMCPGAAMTPDQSDDVYAGRLNYRRGEWRQETPLVRMPLRSPAEQALAEQRVRELEEEVAGRA